MKTPKAKVIGLLATAFILSSTLHTDRPVITIFMIGDSIMASKKIDGGNPRHGQGMVLFGFFSEDMRIDNHATNGRSSKSLISEGCWEKVIPKAKREDYVFIRSGHNDEKADSIRHTDPSNTFDEIPRRHVNETRAKDGTPVLFNSIVRRDFVQSRNDTITEDAHRTSGEKEQSEEGAVLFDMHGACLGVPRDVAKELGATFTDMNKITHDLMQGLGPVESKKLFMFAGPNQAPAFPRGCRNNTHSSVYRIRTVVGLAVNAIGKEIPELMEYIRQFDYVAAQDGSGDFFTTQEATNAVPDFHRNVHTTVLIRRGTYKEKLIAPESKISILLIEEDGAILTYDGFASKENVLGENMRTSGLSSCHIYAPNFYVENITFENSSGPVGRAVACFISADRIYPKNCRLLGFQDTFYTYSKQSRQYYEDCYIEGTVDFAFGWSVAVFDRCHIHSKRDGYVTAPSTDKGKKYGYVFYDCEPTAEPEATKICLSRPWHPYAQAVSIRYELGKHILPAGWNNRGKKENEKTAFCAEHESRGKGANPKAHAVFFQQLKSLQGHEIMTALVGGDGWDPVADENKLMAVKR